MELSYQDVTLDNDTPDREGMLVFRNGRLLAVLTRLSDIHGELAGHWFAEALFETLAIPAGPTFESLAHFEEWLAARDEGTPTPS